MRDRGHLSQLPIDNVESTIGNDRACDAGQKEKPSEDGHSDGCVRDSGVKMIWLSAFGWLLGAAGLLQAIFWLVYRVDRPRFVGAAIVLGIVSTIVAVFTTDHLIGAIDRLP